MNDGYDGLQQIIDEALDSMAAEATGSFDLQTCNLADSVTSIKPLWYLSFKCQLF